MATYDPKIINEFADRLYKRAQSIIINYSVIGLFLGGMCGFITKEKIAMIIFALAGLIVGFLMGREKAFTLKLQAQTALCQVQIEKNSQK